MRHVVFDATCLATWRGFRYGDEKLHFRHQRIDEDWQLNPEFLSQYDAAKACGRGAVRADGAPKKCAAY
jgi:hypothetical protein